jgi:hypothetical protein
MDIFPTIATICDLPEDVFVKPIDGNDIAHLFYKNSMKERYNPIPFKYRNQGALIDNDFKLVAENIEKKEYAPYLQAWKNRPEFSKQLKEALEKE